MKTFELNAELRADAGKKFAKRIRKAESVPAVIYGGEKNIMISLNAKELDKAVCTPNVYIVNIAVEGKTYSTIVKEAQFHPVSDKLIHVDFYEVNDSNPVTIFLPITLVGQAEGTKQGGKLIQVIRKMRVNGIAKNLPEVIEVDVTNLTIGKSIMVGDLNFDNFHIVESKSLVIATIKTTRATREADEAAAEAK